MRLTRLSILKYCFKFDFSNEYLEDLQKHCLLLKLAFDVSINAENNLEKTKHIKNVEFYAELNYN